MKNHCNGNCNQGRNCDCVAPSNHDRSDRYFKWFLICGILYFLGHMASAALAQPAPSPTQPPVLQCWSNGMGTVQCIQI